MKNIIIVIGIGVVVLGLLLWGKSGSSAPEGPAIETGKTSATITELLPEYDFGEVSMAKGNVAHIFELRNTRDEDILIDRVETSCMCTKAVLVLSDGSEKGPFGMAGHGFLPSVDAKVKSGETFAIRAVFDPAAHGPSGIGPVERSIMIGTNSGPIEARFKAVVTP